MRKSDVPDAMKEARAVVALLLIIAFQTKLFAQQQDSSSSPSALTAFAKQLESQRARGKRYLISDRLSALDVYWAACCGILDPMPPERCPMADGFRGAYGNTDRRIDQALTRELRAHRDFIYDEHLEMPIVF